MASDLDIAYSMVELSVWIISPAAIGRCLVRPSPSQFQGEIRFWYFARGTNHPSTFGSVGFDLGFLGSGGDFLVPVPSAFSRSVLLVKTGSPLPFMNILEGHRFSLFF